MQHRDEVVINKILSEISKASINEDVLFTGRETVRFIISSIKLWNIWPLTLEFSNDKLWKILK